MSGEMTAKVLMRLRSTRGEGVVWRGEVGKCAHQRGTKRGTHQRELFMWFWSHEPYGRQQPFSPVLVWLSTVYGPYKVRPFEINLSLLTVR